MPITVHKQVVVNASSFALIGEGDDGEKMTITSSDGDTKISVSTQELADSVRVYCRESKIRFGARRQRKTGKEKESKAEKAAA